jgi:hypothetical protein
MLDVLRPLTVILIALAMVPALAHALELPGKRRLPREAYVTVQRIYYPGFTIAGIAEPVAIIATTALLALVPRGAAAFWLVLAGWLALLGMHAVYWLVTHPVNKFWVQGAPMSRAGSRFFSTGAGGNAGDDWTRLRDRWEYSHVARAALVGVSFVALVAVLETGA